MDTFDGFHFLLTELEAGASFSNGTPVHVNHGVPDGCFENLLGVLGPTIRFPLQDEHVRYIIHVLRNDIPEFFACGWPFPWLFSLFFYWNSH